MNLSIVEQLAVLGSEVNANQYKIVRLAAQFDAGLEWFKQGHKNPSVVIAESLGIHTSTACEWIRVGHALEDLPLIDNAFATNELSYAKTRILTRRADPENEHELLELAYDRTANRLTAAIANHLAGDESEDEQDQRHHDNRSVTVRTDAEGMVIIRAALPPNIGKPIAEALDVIIKQVAATPADDPTNPPDPSADEFPPRFVDTPTAESQQNSSADESTSPTMGEQIHELRQRWHPADQDDFCIPSLAQQRADAFALLFLGKNIDLETEVVIHVRGDGSTFDDGTPITSNAVCQRLDQSFIRMMIHDSERRPIDATNRRRHPTTRQKRVVFEAHNHECVDCQDTDLLELDHNPPYSQTRHTVTIELEPRCAPCHRARHRHESCAGDR